MHNIIKHVFSNLFNLYLKFKLKTFLDFIKNDINIEDNENKIINELKKKIKILEKINKEKDQIINEEKTKNANLIIKITELENKINNNYQNNKILELEDKINQLKLYCLSPREKLDSIIFISVKFISVDQIINFKLIAKDVDKFSKFEDMLYSKYPKYRDKDNIFLVNGGRINTKGTLKENNIKNNDVITLSTFDISSY